MSKSLDTIQADLDLWMIEAHGNPTISALLHKLMEESLETVGFPKARIEMYLAQMSREFIDWDEVVIREEIVDVAIVCLAIAGYLGFSLRDGVEKKMAINKVRGWTVDPDGRLRHQAEGNIT